MTSVTIPNSVSSLGNGAFSDCGLVSVIFNADSCIRAGGRVPVFNGCNGLATFIFGNNVKCIPNRLCYGLSGLTSVIINDSVTHIGNSAFQNCIGLTSVTIPNSVTTIGNSTFNNCSTLTSVTIPNSVTTIGDSAFFNCIGLTTITIPNSVTTIGNYTFDGCRSLTSVTIPNSVTSIGRGAFLKCSFVTCLATTPPNINSIESVFRSGCPICVPCGLENRYRNTSGWRFYNIYASVTAFTITYNSNTRISYSINCDSASVTLINGSSGGALIIPDSVSHNGNTYAVTAIGNQAFFGLSGLTSVTIPNSVTSIGNYAFRECYGLTSVTIPNSVTSIGGSAFYGCTSLTTITIPTSVTSIGGNAFSGCSELTYITCLATTPPCNSTAFGSLNGYQIDASIPVCVPCGSGNAYRSAWNYFNNIQESHASFILACSTGQRLIYSLNCDSSSVTIIGHDGNCSGNLVIPDSVTYNGSTYTVTDIGKNAFVGASQITNLTIGNSVITIGDSAFRNCQGLSGELRLPRSLISIGNAAFCNCSNLSNIIIGDSTTTIGNSAFYGCSRLSRVTITSNVFFIGEYAFKGCSLISVASLAMTPPILRNGVFSGILASAILYVPCGASSAYRAASGWSSFTNIQTAPSHLTICSTGQTLTYTIDCTTGNATITGYKDTCRGMLNIPSNITLNRSTYPVKTIGNGAFSGCTALSSVTIPNSVDIIGNSAFSGCTALTSVLISNSVDTIGNSAFSGCTALTSVIIGNSVDIIGNSAFSGCTALSSVTIGSSVDTIRANAFYNCSHLASITSNAVIPPVTVGDAAIFRYISSTIPVYVPCGSEATYRATAGWSYFSNLRGALNSTVTTAAACNNYTWSVHGYTNNYTHSGTYWHTRTSSGCSGTDTLYLTIYNPSDTSYTMVAFGSYTWINHGISNTYTQSGTYFNNYTTPEGCTGTDTLYLTITTSSSGSFNLNATSSDPLRGMVTGGGYYTAGTIITLAAIPNYGYYFLRWSDGNTNNPRTIQLATNTTLSATFDHYPNDTTFVHVHDTTIIRQQYHDTTYIPIHDTAIVHSHDTIYAGGATHDTVYVNLSIHDTTYIVQHDTTYINIGVHDTTYIRQYDTVYIGGTLHDTLYLILGVHDTALISTHDSILMSLYDTLYIIGSFHDTTYVFLGVHDTAYISVHDTAYISLYDTVYLGGSFHDTVYINLGVHDTAYISVHDTAYISLYDTVYLGGTFHDTTYINLHDTVYMGGAFYDTIYINMGIHDTTYINIHDTTYISLYDTVYMGGTFHDTTIVNIHDTITNTIFDTIYSHTSDTTWIHDTTIVVDTLWITLHDTIIIHDTIYINDSANTSIEGVSAINVKVFSSNGYIVVEGAGSNPVTLFDITGRRLATKQDDNLQLLFSTPASGTYLIKVGKYPARKIVVIK